MSFLLDTNVLSAHLRRPAGLAHRFFQYSGRLYTSSIVLLTLVTHNTADFRNIPDLRVEDWLTP